MHKHVNEYAFSIQAWDKTGGTCVAASA